MIVSRDRAADRRRRRFDDLQRSRQESELFAPSPAFAPHRDDASHRLDGKHGLADFMDACLQAMQRWRSGRRC